VVKFPIGYITEEGGVTSLAAYLDELSLKNQDVYPGISTGQPVTNVSVDNSGVGGQAVIILALAFSLNPGVGVIWPANWSSVRGANGEWIAPQRYVMP
jgi:hypothetical protein